MAYTLDITNKAFKQLNGLPKEEYPRVRESIDLLVHDPRPHNSIKLKGSVNDYRLRIGNYRILYTIEDKILLITVFRIADRKDAY